MQTKFLFLSDAAMPLRFCQFSGSEYACVADNAARIVSLPLRILPAWCLRHAGIAIPPHRHATVCRIPPRLAVICPASFRIGGKTSPPHASRAASAGIGTALVPDFW